MWTLKSLLKIKKTLSKNNKNQAMAIGFIKSYEIDIDSTKDLKGN